MEQMASKRTDPPFIVAEISKNWLDGNAVVDSPILCQQFENVIEFNRQRGYYLHSWKLDRHGDQGALNETIIAVFTNLEIMRAPH